MCPFPHIHRHQQWQQKQRKKKQRDEKEPIDYVESSERTSFVWNKLFKLNRALNKAYEMTEKYTYILGKNPK